MGRKGADARWHASKRRSGIGRAIVCFRLRPPAEKERCYTSSVRGAEFNP